MSAMCCHLTVITCITFWYSIYSFKINCSTVLAWTCRQSELLLPLWTEGSGVGEVAKKASKGEAHKRESKMKTQGERERWC